MVEEFLEGTGSVHIEDVIIMMTPGCGNQFPEEFAIEHAKNAFK